MPRRVSSRTPFCHQRVTEQPDISATALLHGVLLTENGEEDSVNPSGHRRQRASRVGEQHTARRERRPGPQRARTETQHSGAHRHCDRLQRVGEGPSPGPAGPNDTSSACAQRVKCSLIDSARSAKRRNQRRTLHAGNPSRIAILRCPSPAALASIAPPITATSSRRLTKASSPNSTWVRPHTRHLPRRGRTRSSLPPRRRNGRARA